ncbi:MAG TPA: hypothetical protein VKU94_03465 [Geobacterales bacterium]|nr:hypothetical protein [Geobacterales bacterium]
MSQIHFYLFGLIPINSTLNITWSTGYDKNWVAESTYNLTNFNKIGNVIIRVSKLDPFIIVYQRLDPAITNSSAKLIVSVMNIGTLNVPEVTVKLNIPDWLKANNQTLIFKNVSSVMQQKYVNVTVNGNLNPGVYEINAPTCYYTYNSTSIATIGNTVQFGYKAGKLPSLSFYLRPSVTEWPDLFTGLADFNVFIINTGNYNASDVEIDMDYYKAIVGDLGAGKNITYPISIQPSLINQVPQGASVFNSVLVKYYNGTQSYVVKIPSPSIATIGSSFTFINYMSAKAEVYNQVINQTSMYFRWIGSTLGSARSATVTIYMNNITSQGLLYAGHDSFNNYGSTLQATFSNARGYQTYIALNLNLTRRDAFVIPAFVTISPFSKSILIDPIVFINALVITKSTNSSIIKINSPVEINLVAKNYGSAPLYNVSLKDILATGWNVISGVTEGYKDVLLPNESLSINYVAVPKTPQTSNIGTSNVTFKLFGLNITSALTSFQLKISVSVSFNVYKWNKATLSSGSVVIYDLNNNLVAQLPINNGKVDWEGYIGVFSVVVKYQNVDVFTEKLNITSQTRSVNLTVNVFDIEVNVYDAFGFKVSNAEVQLIGNFNEIAQAGSFYSLSNVPQGVYILSVKIGDYLYKIPINIDNSTSTVIDIHLPVLVLGNFTLNISYLIGVLLILFIALFIILYFRKEKFSS